MNLSERLQSLRKEHKLTQKELGKKLGVGISTVSMWELGERVPQYTMLEAIADLFNIDMDYLTGRSDIKNKINAIHPLPPFITKEYPLIGKVACGEPIEAIELNETISLDLNIDCDCVLIARGDSMIEADIYDGDLVLIKQQEHLNNGEIGCIVVDDSVTLKKFYDYGNMIVLRPCNKDYKELVYDKDSHLEYFNIYGRCVGVVHKL